MQHLVVLHARGGRDIGIGHLSRTATLATALQQTGKFDRVLLVWQTTAELARHFLPEHCGLKLATTDDDALAQLQESVCLAHQLTLVTDLLHLGEQDIARFRNLGYQSIVHLNDSGPGRWCADTVVDGDAFKSAADIPDGFPGTALIGGRFRMLRDTVTSLRPDKPWQKNDVQRILVTFGGADPHDLTHQFLAELAATAESLPFSLLAVVGPAFSNSHQQRLRELAATRPDISIESTTDLGSLILSHDLVVTLGGITGYEVMCLGRPCAAIHCPETAWYSKQLAATELLFDFTCVSAAAQQLATLTGNIRTLQATAERAWKLIDGHGAQRVVESILS